MTFEDDGEKIIAYEVISNNLHPFNLRAKILVDKGYAPVGSLDIRNKGSDFIYYQGFVKYKKDEE